MPKKLKNITFSLPADLLEKYKEYAESNYIPSVNAGVREALAEYSVKLEKKKLAKEMEKAAKDLIFLRDLEESMKAFEAVDHETSGGIDKW